MLLLLLLFSAVAGYDGSVNYWQAFGPGQLLQRLDAITSAGESPVGKQEPQQLQPAQSRLHDYVDDGEEVDDEVDAHDEVDTHDDEVDLQDVGDDLDDDVALVDSAEGHSGEDYEHNYEHFVREYFDRVTDGDDAVDAHGDYDSLETQAEATNLQRQHRPKIKQHKQQLHTKVPHTSSAYRAARLSKLPRVPDKTGAVATPTAKASPIAKSSRNEKPQKSRAQFTEQVTTAKRNFKRARLLNSQLPSKTDGRSTPVPKPVVYVDRKVRVLHVPRHTVRRVSTYRV